MDQIFRYIRLRERPFRPISFTNTILGVCMVLCVASFAISASLILFFPYGVNYGEAPIIDQALKFATGQNIYNSSLQSPPYTIANYPPLYPFLLSWWLRLTDLPLFQAGRMLSIFSTLISSIMLGLIARKFCNSPAAGFVAGTVFLAQPYVGLWSSLARVDAMALAFNLTGLWIIFSHWHSKRWLILAMSCFLSAIYTRQTFLLTALLTSTLWLSHKNQKRAMYFLGTFLCIGFITFLFINLSTHGGFYTHIVTANINDYDIMRVLKMGGVYLLSSPFLFLLSAMIFPNRNQSSAQSFFTWGLLPYTIGALLTALTVGKTGSDINYFLEFISALSLLAGCVWRNKPGKVIYLLLVINTLWIVTFNSFILQKPMLRSWNNLSKLDSIAQKVKLSVRQGPVLADDRLDMVVLAGQPIYYQPFEITQLHMAGIWDSTEFTNEIVSQKFSLILISGNTINKPCCWPEETVKAIERYYEITQEQGLFYCYPLRR